MCTLIVHSESVFTIRFEVVTVILRSQVFWNVILLIFVNYVPCCASDHLYKLAEWVLMFCFVFFSEHVYLLMMAYSFHVYKPREGMGFVCILASVMKIFYEDLIGKLLEEFTAQ